VAEAAEFSALVARGGQQQVAGCLFVPVSRAHLYLKIHNTSTVQLASLHAAPDQGNSNWGWANALAFAQHGVPILAVKAKHASEQLCTAARRQLCVQ